MAFSMLPKTNKLSRVTFPKHTDPKKTWIGACLRIQYTYIRSDASTQWAIVVSKKVSSSAVKRNALKRMIFHAIEGHGSQLLLKRGLKIVIYPLLKNGPLSRQIVEKDIQRFVSELG